MAVLTVQQALETGLEATYVAASVGGDEFENDGKTFFHVKNGGAADRTVTVDRPLQCNQGFTHDPAIVVTLAEERIIGPFPVNEFNDSNRRVQVTYDAVTSVTVAAIRL